MKGLPVTAVTLPDKGKTICHTGISTGVACGQLADDMLVNEYLTTAMAPSIPGDSGGPVWQLNDDATSATVVGIWLGEHDDGRGGHNGRFYPLTHAFVDLTISSLQN
ncbi:hypothetical protein [Mycobacterium sp.]|jgi:streptogrisin B|uniref:hypothetical protein n=1 Tax=Mycobacterium sp. TaxID=1785 RepID=UPI003340F4A9|nr:hypothetical protein [Mycobacterium sp.]